MRDHRIVELVEGRLARIAGRVLSVGPASEDPSRWRIALADATGQIDCVGEGPAPVTGDIVSLHGVRTSLDFEVQSLESLLHPLRSPFSDPEWRRLSDPAHRRRLEARAALIGAVRSWFVENGFTEVETGQLVDEPGQEPTLDPFVVSGHRSLITSPELRMKRMLCAGFERIFELSHAFRDGLGERSHLHHPEFTMLEWYRAYDDEWAIVRDLEGLLPALAVAAVPWRASAATFSGASAATIQWSPPFEVISVADAFLRFASVDLEPFLDRDFAAFRTSARAAGVRAVTDDEDAESLFFRVMLDLVEPHLGAGRPTILHGYPAQMAALARVDESDPRVARRFELYVDGVELANAFFELNDPIEQARRFAEDRAKKRSESRDPGPMPERFLAALEGGMPPSAGIALGVDRLVMRLLGVDRIDDVLAFPDRDPSVGDAEDRDVGGAGFRSPV